LVALSWNNLISIQAARPDETTSACATPLKFRLPCLPAGKSQPAPLKSGGRIRQNHLPFGLDAAISGFLS
jgi:hypothetical protein